MVTAARLDWVINQLQIVRQSRVQMVSYIDRVILQITLLTSDNASMHNCIAINWLYFVRDGLGDVASNDTVKNIACNDTLHVSPLGMSGPSGYYLPVELNRVTIFSSRG